MSRKNRGPAINKNFVVSAKDNTYTFEMFLQVLYELAVNRYKWYNLPDTMSERMLELNLNGYGAALIFKDEIMDIFLNGQLAYDQQLSIYGDPVVRGAIMYNGIQYRDRTAADSVIVYNNRLRTSTYPIVRMYAEKMWDAQASADTNVHLQKYPILVKTSKRNELTFRTIMQKYQGNEPIIYGTDDLDLTGLDKLDLSVPFMAPQLLEYKKNLWNECLIMLGIANNYTEKSERMVTGEVNNSQGATNAYRESGLRARQYACDQFNRLWPDAPPISVEFNVEVESMATEVTPPEFREIEVT